MTHERDIIEPVRLCTPDGTLDPRAVGWSRRPLHECNVPPRRFARKRWNYWAITTERHLFSATIANLDYAGLAFVYVADLERGLHREQTLVTPFGRRCAMPEVVDAPVVFHGPGMAISLDQSASGARILVEAPRFDRRGLTADLTITRPPAHDTLNVVIPWSSTTFQFTSKQQALPAQGTVRVGDETLAFDGPQSFACLDFGRGIWPRRCTWNWGAASGVVGSRTIGLNLGGQWTDGTGMTENGVCVDGRLTKIGEPLTWEYDRSDYRRPWRVVTPESGAVRLTFTPRIERLASTNVVVLRSVVHQCLGHWDGEIRTDAGETIPLRGVPGWAEEHVARW